MTTLVLVFLGAAGPVAWEAVASRSAGEDKPPVDHSPAPSKPTQSKLTQTKPAQTAAAPSRPTAPPTLVRAFLVGSAPAGESANAFTGTVRARYEVQVAFRVSGKILKRHIEIGDRVVRGQLLFELDREDYLLQQKNALANVEVTKAAQEHAAAEEQRLAILRQTNAVGESEYEAGLSNRIVTAGRYDAAQKQLELANNQLSYCQLMADADGIVTSIEAEAGQVVSMGTRVCTVAQGGELEAVIDIPENRLPDDRELTAKATFWSLPGVETAARLRELSPTADPVTRTFRGRFTLVNPSPDIRLGMTATVQWSDGRNRDTVAIPASSIFEQDGHPAVWRIDLKRGRLTAVPIAISHYDDKQVYVASGLTGGEHIVSAGVHKLDAGMRVRVWESP
ncbi:MAG: efflux RND transporter periplasmic adaptor subunit [Aureliella sp.]